MRLHHEYINRYAGYGRGTSFLQLTQVWLGKDEIDRHQLIHVSTVSRIHHACWHTWSSAPDAAVRSEPPDRLRTNDATVKSQRKTSPDSQHRHNWHAADKNPASAFKPTTLGGFKAEPVLSGAPVVKKTVRSTKPARLNININMPAPALAIAYLTKLLPCWSNKLQLWRHLCALTFKPLTGCATWQPKPR